MMSSPFGTRLNSSNYLTIVLALFIAAVMAMPVRAGVSEPDAAARFVQSFTDEAIRKLSDKQRSNAEKEADFRSLLVRGFNLDGIGRFLVGSHWRAMKPAEQKEYLAAFEDYLVATYSRRMNAYSGEGLDVVSAKKRKKDFIVLSWLKSERRPDMRIDWRVRRMDGKWKILDVSIEGISMIVTQRSEFASVLRESGGDVAPLTAQLRAKWNAYQATKAETIAAN